MSHPDIKQHIAEGKDLIRKLGFTKKDADDFYFELEVAIGNVKIE